jgi:hypothetical protein
MRDRKRKRRSNMQPNKQKELEKPWNAYSKVDAFATNNFSTWFISLLAIYAVQ